MTSTNLAALLLVLCEEGILKERTHVTSVRVKYWLWGKSNERSRSVRDMVACLESDDLRVMVREKREQDEVLRRKKGKEKYFFIFFF